MALSYASNIQRKLSIFFHKCNLSITVSYMMIIISRDAVLGSSVWFFSLI